MNPFIEQTLWDLQVNAVAAYILGIVGRDHENEIADIIIKNQEIYDFMTPAQKGSIALKIFFKRRVK